MSLCLLTCLILEQLSQVASSKLMAQSEHAYLGISQDLTYTLAELYFETAYNASLLLHKASFLASLAAGTACPHVVLSVCAWGAKYVCTNTFRSLED